jgi:hypothetical protein
MVLIMLLVWLKRKEFAKRMGKKPIEEVGFDELTSLFAILSDSCVEEIIDASTGHTLHELKIKYSICKMSFLPTSHF